MPSRWAGGDVGSEAAHSLQIQSTIICFNHDRGILTIKDSHQQVSSNNAKAEDGACQEPMEASPHSACPSLQETVGCSWLEYMRVIDSDQH